MVLKDISHLPLRSEEDARTSWCPCVNPASLQRNRLDSLMPLAPYALSPLVIQLNKSRNWKSGTNTSSLKHETMRSADQCRVPRVTQSKATCAHGTRTSCAHRDTAPLSTTNATIRTQGKRVPKTKNPTAPLALLYSDPKPQLEIPKIVPLGKWSWH